MVVVEHTTESFPAEHPSVLVRRRRRALEQHIVETLVVPLTMVVLNVLSDGTPQMAFSQRHYPVEAFALDRQYKSLRVRVQVRTSRGQQQRLHPCPAQHLPELLRVQRIAVQDQVPLPPQESVVGVQQVARHLLHPLTAWVPRHPHHFDHAAPDVDHKQHVVPDQPQRRHKLHREEIHSGDHTKVRLDERRPRVLALPLRRRLDAVLPQDPLYRRSADLVAQVVQRVPQPRVAPSRVLPGHLPAAASRSPRPSAAVQVCASCSRRTSPPPTRGTTGGSSPASRSWPPVATPSGRAPCPASPGAGAPRPSAGAGASRAVPEALRSPHAGTRSPEPAVPQATSRSRPPETATALAASSPPSLASPSVPFAPSTRRDLVCTASPCPSASTWLHSRFSRSSFGTQRASSKVASPLVAGRELSRRRYRHRIRRWPPRGRHAVCRSDSPGFVRGLSRDRCSRCRRQVRRTRSCSRGDSTVGEGRCVRALPYSESRGARRNGRGVRSLRSEARSQGRA